MPRGMTRSKPLSLQEGMKSPASQGHYVGIMVIKVYNLSYLGERNKEEERVQGQTEPGNVEYKHI